MQPDSPFCTDNTDAYLKWRQDKLSGYPVNPEALFVDLSGSAPEQQAISSLRDIIRRYNMAFYRFTDKKDFRNKQLVHALGAQLGLVNLDKNLCADEDKLTSITVREHKNQHSYIPYTSRRLSWHTDGYYNSPDKQIRGMLLHCAQPAIQGGANRLLDIEIAYILLRDANPDYISALMQPDAMTIPANILKGKVIRDAQTGPVFSVSAQGHLHMRYSARQRNILWKADKNVQAAARFLQDLWEQGSPYILQYQLQAGEGLVCNNVLHNRTAFEDSSLEGEKRLLYRGRYYDRVSGELGNGTESQPVGEDRDNHQPASQNAG